MLSVEFEYALRIAREERGLGRFPDIEIVETAAFAVPLVSNGDRHLEPN